VSQRASVITNWYVYILHCKDRTFYTGITSNINRRLKEHQDGRGGRYTGLSEADRIVYWERHNTKEKALIREKQIKGWRREKKLNLIKYGNPKMPA